VIVTLTANPSVDRTIEVDRLDRGEVVRATGGRIDPGGKGVNVARALVANGTPARAVLPVGGAEGRQLVGLLAAVPGLDVVAVPVSGAVRANVTVVEPGGTTTKLNEAGPHLSPEEVEALEDAFVHAATGAEWAVLSGSLPPGVPADLYAELTARLHAIGVQVAVDSSGAALDHAVTAGPDLLKPNREELAAVAGLPVTDLGSAIDAVVRVQQLAGPRAMVPDGGLALDATAVLVSLGAAGALLVEGSGTAGSVHAESEPIVPRSTVGAGDAALAGFLHAGGHGPAALIEAVAWGTAATGLPGSRPPGPDDIDRRTVHVHPAIRSARLLEGELHASHLR
jgi:1-phosphofructokinase